MMLRITKQLKTLGIKLVTSYKMTFSSFFHDHLRIWAQLCIALFLLMGSVFYLTRDTLNWENHKETLPLEKWVAKYSSRGEEPNPSLYNVKLNFKSKTLSLQGYPLDKLNEVNYLLLRQKILNELSPKLSKRLDRYIDWSFFYAQKYQLDPFWILSVIWSESHFNSEAHSHANAIGLMQLLPRTASSMMRKLNLHVPKNIRRYLSEKPSMNIRLGTYYLAKLLKRFEDYRLATVAYNMGPTWTSRRLSRSQEVGRRNTYLNKVLRAYGVVSRNFFPHSYQIRTAQN